MSEAITPLARLLHRPLFAEGRGGQCLSPHHGPLLDAAMAPPIDWFSRDCPAGAPYLTAYNSRPLVFEHHGWAGAHLRELWLYEAGEPDENGMANVRGQLQLVVPFHPPGVPAGAGPVVIPPGALQVFADREGNLLPGFSPAPTFVMRMPVPGWTMRQFIYDPAGFEHNAILYLDSWGRIAGATVIEQVDGRRIERHWAFEGPPPHCPATTR